MKCANWFVVVGALVVATAVPAKAQGEERKEVQGYFAGGYVAPQGRADEFLNDGWNISAGAIIRPLPGKPLGVRVDFGFSHMDASTGAINFANTSGLRADDGFVNMTNLTAEVLWEFGSPDKIGGYVGLGMGGYRRYAALTSTALVSGIYCDPWWGWCYPTTVVGDVITQDDKLTKFGYSASAGLTFPAGHGEMYLEARYHYMVSSPATEYIPILLGYRF